ncbi:hypothetical protein [Catalinimonas niigatensis]|uniref:hypothetical protein n=1 Tax=Catalinimonas niigatensis TaxID=1397264 RepID=UPI002665D376|nr:hypothetical protein [Catalinimonas niigatensis]WPP52251.1 hypothetical protein PZB72_07640 [Catalinimonas niigatensis]
MKNYVLITIMMVISHITFGQPEPGVESGLFRLEQGTFNSQQLMMGKRRPPADVIGDYYLTAYWQEGSFVMKDGRKSSTYLLRYDVENALLEIRWKEEQVKVVGEEFLSSFVWQNKDTGKEQQFINAHHFSYGDTRLSGFMELMHTGHDSLLIKTEAYLKKPTYVEGLDMGIRHAEILKQDKFFVSRKGKLSEIRNRKDILTLVEEPYQKAVKQFMKSEHIASDQREGLLRVWKFYESIRENL